MTQQLYPRLSVARASELRSSILSSPSSPTFDQSMLNEELLAADVFPPSGGTRVSAQELLDLRAECSTAIEGLSHGSELDLALGRVFYEVSRESIGEFGNSRVWDFLTLVLLPDVAVRRFPLSGKGVDVRFVGGNRRHVFQRLWRRWNVLGRDLVESRVLAEDEYQAIFERTLTSEMKNLTVRAAAEIQRVVEAEEYDRREFTRTFMKQLLQTTGLVSVSDSDVAHLEALVVHVSAMTKRVLDRS